MQDVELNEELQEEELEELEELQLEEELKNAEARFLRWVEDHSRFNFFIYIMYNAKIYKTNEKKNEKT